MYLYIPAHKDNRSDIILAIELCSVPLLAKFLITCGLRFLWAKPNGREAVAINILVIEHFAPIFRTLDCPLVLFTVGSTGIAK